MIDDWLRQGRIFNTDYELVRYILYTMGSWVSSEFVGTEKGLTTNSHELTRRESRMTRIAQIRGIGWPRRHKGTKNAGEWLSGEWGKARRRAQRGKSRRSEIGSARPKAGFRHGGQGFKMPRHAQSDGV